MSGFGQSNTPSALEKRAGETSWLCLRKRAKLGPPVLDFISLSTHRDAVDRFHAAALRAGGIDCGRPGPRPQYGATYYAAFVLDPDGYKLEAVHQ
jgi:catechol 2,3-dioxygenase-like lactoylglutathione lyase family enzyme